MSARLPSDLLAQIVAVLQQKPEGLSIARIEEALGRVASRRSLQRRLEQGIRSGAIRVEGARRGARYFVADAAAQAAGVVTPTPATTPTVIEGIPLSTAGAEIQALVRRPIADRSPVGYAREFLERYTPNESSYLTDALKAQLYELGRTPEERQPAGTYARDILSRLLIDLSWSSSRLEGNTYSLLDTRELIEKGTEASGKDPKETQMILNHKAAIELLVESGEDVGVNRYTITNLHALLADNLIEDFRDAGRLRRTAVGIAGSTYLPSANPQLIEEMFERLIEIGAAIEDPFEQSFFLLVHIPYLQPFIDVNKRTSRLASNIPLIRRNLVPLSFIDVPKQVYMDGHIGVYEQNRMELLRDVYLWAYERSVRQYKTVRDSLPEPDPFRLRYRGQLIEVVGEIVRKRLPATAASVRRLANPLVESEHLARFTTLAMEELRALHEGNIARFRLRPSEFKRWTAA